MISLEKSIYLVFYEHDHLNKLVELSQGIHQGFLYLVIFYIIMVVILFLTNANIVFDSVIIYECYL